MELKNSLGACIEEYKHVVADRNKVKLELLHAKAEVRNAKAEVCNAKAELCNAKAEVLKACGLPAIIQKQTDRGSMLRMLGEAILIIVNVVMFRTQPITRLRALCEVIFEKELFGSHATEAVLKDVSLKYARRTIFLPWQILRSIDLAINGGINLTGLESLRQVENLADYQRGYLPSRATVQRCASELHSLGQELIPITRVPCDLGEMYQYEFEKVTRYILKAFSLDHVAKSESVELCITLDGAELTKDLCHLSFGVKMTDSRAINPRYGTPLAYTEEGVFGKIFNVQSRNNCFIIKTLLGKDSKAAYQHFSDVFSFFQRLKDEGLPANENGPRIMPIIVWSPQDLSSIWKSLNTGGGARKTGCKHWCHLCACTGDRIASFVVDDNRFVRVLFFFQFIVLYAAYLITSIFSSNIRCQRCKDLNRERCYHWPVGDEDSIVHFQAELEHRLQQYTQRCGRDVFEVIQQSNIIYNPTEVNRFGNRNNIEFVCDPSGTEELDIIYFNTLVNNELRLRRLTVSGNLEEKRTLLKLHLIIEQKLSLIREAILRTEEGKEAALMLIKQAIVCIMHLENRVGEKLITILLSIGANKFQRENATESLARYVEEMENIVQTRILGTRLRPKPWRLPLNDQRKEVSTYLQLPVCLNMMATN